MVIQHTVSTGWQVGLTLNIIIIVATTNCIVSFYYISKTLGLVRTLVSVNIVSYLNC